MVNNFQPFPVVYTKMIARELHLSARDEKKLFTGTRYFWSIGDQFINEDVDADAQFIIIENALEIYRNPALGLKWGNNLPMAAHGPLGSLLSTSPTLDTALNDLLIFSGVRQNVIIFGRKIRSNELAITVELLIPHNEVGMFFIEAALVSLQNLVLLFAGPVADCLKIELSYPPPRHAEKYAKYLNCNICFNCRETAIVIPRKLAQLSNPFADALAHEQARTRCEDLAATATGSIRWKARARQSMWLTSDRPSLYILAKKLHISPRTLMRHLENEGTNFRALRDEVLARRAIYYLGEKQWKIDAVAVALGYKDGSAFRRAFNRWFGQSPTEYRNKYLELKKKQA